MTAKGKVPVIKSLSLYRENINADYPVWCKSVFVNLMAVSYRMYLKLKIYREA